MWYERATIRSIYGYHRIKYSNYLRVQSSCNVISISSSFLNKIGGRSITEFSPLTHETECGAQIEMVK